MYTKSFFIVFACLFTLQSEVDAQLFRQFAAQRATQSCCNSQSYQQPVQSTYVPTTNYQTYYSGQQSYYLNQPSTAFESFQVVDSVPYYSTLSADPFSPPQYGTDPMPYGPVVGNLPVTSELLLPHDAVTDANTGVPTTALGVSAIEPATAPSTDSQAVPSTETLSAVIPEVPTNPGMPTAATSPSIEITMPPIEQTQAVAPIVIKEPASAPIVETHTIAPVGSNEPAPGEIPGKLEVGDGRDSILDSGN